MGENVVNSVLESSEIESCSISYFTLAILPGFGM